MSNKHRQHEEPIKKLKEWQDNQYNPGYYTGGNIPPYVEIPARTSIFGKLYKKGTRIIGVLEILVGAALIFIGAKIVLLQDYNSAGSFIGNLFGSVAIFGGLGTLFILSGLKYIRKVKSNNCI